MTLSAFTPILRTSQESSAPTALLRAPPKALFDQTLLVDRGLRHAHPLRGPLNLSLEQHTAILDKL